VAAQQDEVVEVLVLPDHAALNLILDHGLAGQGRAKPDRRLDAVWGFRRVAVAPHAVIEPGAAFGARLLAHRRQLFRRRVTAIGLAAGEQLLRHPAVARGPADTADDVPSPTDRRPFRPAH